MWGIAMADRTGSVRKAPDGTIPAQGVNTADAVVDTSAGANEKAGVQVTRVTAQGKGDRSGASDAAAGNGAAAAAATTRAVAAAEKAPRVTAAASKSATGPKSKAATKAGPPAKSSAKATPAKQAKVTAAAA